MVDPKMGKKMVKKKTSVKTEILFCEQVWRFLKPGTGRAAIILPDGILTNSSLQRVRDWLLSKFQLLAVVSLPQSAFAHFGAGVKASIIFVRKRAEKEVPNDDEAIFMAIADNIGYDATGRKTTKVIDTQIVGTAKTEIQRCDLYDVRVTYENVGTEETPQWVERHALTLRDTGILGQYSDFLKDPTPFFV
jgi:type I restriction enzyme M protein